MSSSSDSLYPPQQRRELLVRLKAERVRLSTFRFWRQHTQHPEALAKVGFFYFNQGDRVQCAFCLSIIGEWLHTDSPLEEHKKFAPTCPFMLGLPCGNVPTSADESQAQIIPHIYEINTAAQVSLLCSIGANLTNPKQCSARELNIKTKSYRTSMYTTAARRLKTFTDWPIGLTQRPKTLAAAGFYYLGLYYQFVH